MILQTVSEEALLTFVRQNVRDDLTLYWEEIAPHTASDAVLNDLLSAIQSNFDVNFPLKKGIRQYFPYRDGFYIAILLVYTIIVLLFRRHSAIKLCALHATHQGVSAMEWHARATVF